jgi:hypothetical protein
MILNELKKQRDGIIVTPAHIFSEDGTHHQRRKGGMDGIDNFHFVRMATNRYF